MTIVLSMYGVSTTTMGFVPIIVGICTNPTMVDTNPITLCINPINGGYNPDLGGYKLNFVGYRPHYVVNTSHNGWYDHHYYGCIPQCTMTPIIVCTNPIMCSEPIVLCVTPVV